MITVVKAKRIIGALLIVACPTLTGCSGDTNAVHATPSRTLAEANRVRTAEDLRSALAPAPQGYEPLIPPAAGPFGSVIKLTQGPGLQRCLRYIAPYSMLVSGGREVNQAPVTNVVFVPKNGVLRPGTRRFQAINETLLSLSEASAARLIGLSVPSSCRQLTAHSSLGLARYRLIACKPINIGVAGKIIGYALYANGSRIGQLWTVLFKSRGYVGEVSAVGVKVNDKKVVRLAQSAHTYADRKLQ